MQDKGVKPCVTPQETGVIDTGVHTNGVTWNVQMFGG